MTTDYVNEDAFHRIGIINTINTLMRTSLLQTLPLP